jgi:hypothetical protein
MRAQYYFRKSPDGLPGTCISSLRSRASLKRERVPPSAIREFDEPFCTDEELQQVTGRQIAEHARLILDCDLGFPIILSSDGRVMDGMHRVCKALLQGHDDIEAVRFIKDPAPDYIGVNPDDLPYCG